MNSLFSFLEDTSGGFSSYRLVLVCWSAILMIVWGYTCIITGTIVDIPGGVVTVTGMILAGKVAQRYTEAQTV